MNYFFIGIAGSGMSAIAQYLKFAGHTVSGSDRQFITGTHSESRILLEKEGIVCFEQGSGGLSADTDVVVVSTAIEDAVPEVQDAKRLGKPIIRRSQLLAEIVKTKKTVAIGGTSGKSTTTAMLYEILHHANLHPSVIGGAGLTRLIKEGSMGNAAYAEGDWLIIEADESDGSIVQYFPEIGVLLNVDKDHQDIAELMQLFDIFRSHSTHFIVNRSNPLSAQLSKGSVFDFVTEEDARFKIAPKEFAQKGMGISFTLDQTVFTIPAPGKHNMENALAAIAVAQYIGIPLDVCCGALKRYEGIYRRHQVLGEKNGLILVDDFAHNPVKCAKSIQACQPLADKLIAWFQPHGYGPTRFLRADFVREIASVLRPQDEIWMSEIYYAGGTAVKDISANDLIQDLRSEGAQAYFIPDRNNLLDAMRPHFTKSSTILLMGARDPSLGQFAQDFWQSL